MPEVLVVGAGLSGLSAGVAAARAGRSVLVVDALDRPGGLCGSWIWKGHYVPRACEEFGQSLFDALDALGCPVAHRPSRQRQPEGIDGSWLRALTVIGRALVASTAADVIGDDDRIPVAGQLASITALLGAPAHMVSMDALRSKVWTPSSWLVALRRRPVDPRGPQAITDALVRGLESAGGVLQLGTRVQSMEDDGEIVVQTDRGSLTADVLVRSPADWRSWPSEAPVPMELSQVLFLLDGEGGLPDDVDVAMLHPRPVARWMRALDAGFWPEGGPGVALFSVPAQRRGCRVVGAYLPTPRGESHWASPARRVDDLLARIEAFAQGFTARVTDWTVVDPARFRALHGLRPLPVPRLAPPGFTPPPAVRGRTIHLNAAVSPAVDQADSAVCLGLRLGRRAAEMP